MDIVQEAKILLLDKSCYNCFQRSENETGYYCDCGIPYLSGADAAGTFPDDLICDVWESRMPEGK